LDIRGSLVNLHLLVIPKDIPLVETSPYLLYFPNTYTRPHALLFSF